MLLFAHCGIPVGAIWSLNKMTAQPKFDRARRRLYSNVSRNSISPNTTLVGTFAWIDYRLVILGSLLPDLIDKPLGIWLLRNTLSNGRIFAHTLLFTFFMMAIGIYMHVSRRRPGVLYLSSGCVAHLCLDQMWLNPRTLLWPVYGWSFGRENLSNWLKINLTSVAENPSVYIAELIGAIMLTIFFASIIQQGKLYAFLKTGKAG